LRGAFPNKFSLLVKVMFRTVVTLGVLAAAISLTACEASKSSTPLSPSVAGPIPGVNISAPKMLEPIPGTRISVDKQPVTLLIENAGSNGVRPLTYSFDIATDAAFNSKVFSRDAIAPGDGGRTSLRLSDALATGHTYYWRARAQDGANTGPYANAAAFDVFTPIVIDVPGLTSPAPNSTVLSLRPTFTLANSPRSGPVGAITYLLELADSDSFANKVATWTAAETPNHTVLISPVDLTSGKVYYWHARAYDPTTVGPWSATQAFQTVVVAPPVSNPSPSPGGPAPNDAINLAQAAVYNSPADIASWAVTSRITSLSMDSQGLSFEFTTKQSWPDVIPPGFDGPLEYTVWAVVNINGRWYTSGFVQMWRGRASTGAPILSDFARNWAYDSRWGPMAGYQPHAGEQMGFFVSAGNARNFGSVTSLRERSNVVIVSLPPNDAGFFPF
jgi:hypothetical protein